MHTTFDLPQNAAQLTEVLGDFAALVNLAADDPEAAALVHEGLVEHVSLDYREVDPPGRGLGDWDTYESVIETAEGEHVATLHGTGRILYERSRDGHMMMYYREKLTFPDGTAETAGWLDGTAIIGGAWQRFPVIGTGGAQSGKLGIRSFRPTPEAPHARYDSNLLLTHTKHLDGAVDSPEALDRLLALLGSLICPAVNPETDSGRLEPPARSAFARD
ncbi:allene oxide cyclase barrel-like domain-containing protein [Streptomyces niveus]